MQRIRADTAIAAGLAIALGAVAFVTTGGEQGVSSANTWTEIALVLAGAALAILLVVAGGRGPAWGAVAVALFGGVAALTAMSIAWSVEPDQSWIEASRTLGFFAAFGAAAISARLFPGRWPAAVGGIALAAIGVSLWAVLAKVFSWPIDDQVATGRLLLPFDYWNATGLMAALGLPAVLWAASRRPAGVATRAGAVPAIALLIVVVVLTYSRSALAAAVLGTAVPLVLGQTRLRSVLMLALGGAVALAICVWALSDQALTTDFGTAHVTHATRTAAGHTFGIVLLVALLGLGVAAVVVVRLADRTMLEEGTRRRIGTALAGLLALVPVVAVVALFASARGFTGEISHIWRTLTSTTGHVGDTASRLEDLANSRPAYWHQGVSVGEHHLLAGAGAGSFGVAHLRYPTAQLTQGQQVPNAHSYAVETFADFGLIGVALNVLLLIAWLRATGRTLGSWLPRGPRDPAGSERELEHERELKRDRELERERDGMLALLGVAVAFGASSAIDWTWFFPGLTVPALVAAGWLAGRGPLDRRIGLAPRRERRVPARPAAILGATAIAVASLALAFAIWQPLRSADADSAALSAELSGNVGGALNDARAAVADFPVSLTAIQQLAAFERAAGDPAQDERELVHATSVQPQNPESWTMLGGYALAAHQYALARRAFSQALELQYHDFALELEIDAAQGGINSERAGTS